MMILTITNVSLHLLYILHALKPRSPGGYFHFVDEDTEVWEDAFK